MKRFKLTVSEWNANGMIDKQTDLVYAESEVDVWIKCDEFIDRNESKETYIKIDVAEAPITSRELRPLWWMIGYVILIIILYQLGLM